MLSLREFGITDPSSNYSLCEVTAGSGGVVKQRRLPDQMQNLAERIALGSRLAEEGADAGFHLKERVKM